jgi:hypothetical protein
VALENPFICPECGSALAPPALEKIASRARRVALLAASFAFVVIVAGATVLVQAGFFAKPEPPPEAAPPTIALSPVLLPPVPPVMTAEVLQPPPTERAPAEESARPVRSPHSASPRATRPRAAGANTPGRRHADVHMSVSVPLIAGGLPEYPEQYDDGRSGSVTVACALEPDGSATRCQTLRVSGGPIFGVAVHSWLELKDVRFRVVKIRGRAPLNGVTLTVRFIGEAAPT